MILLDSDHASILLDPRNVVRARLIERLRQVIDEVRLPIIVVEEQLRGWLALIHRVRDLNALVEPYLRLGNLIDFLGEWPIVQWSDRAAQTFKDMRRSRVRIGTQDLRIASIALVHGATLLSSNLVDFQHVPGLEVEDWLQR